MFAMQSENPPLVDYDTHFRLYAAAFERSLGDRIEFDSIRSYFAPDFMSLAITGGALVGRNDHHFVETLGRAYQFYQAIGTRRMRVERVEAAEIYPNHDRVRVFYTAEYERRDGSTVSISFDVLYLVQRGIEGPKIFAFIAGDEMQLYRDHNLVDADGNPGGNPSGNPGGNAG